MSEPEPEELLAQALRAQAVQARVSDDLGAAWQPSGFELFSGSEYVDDDYTVPASQLVASAPLLVTITPQLKVHWILILSILLGLAAGSVAGLITLLD
jgi:hypothetical protein